MKELFQCGVTTKQGLPCRAYVAKEGDKCFRHSDDPKLREKARLASLRGGLKRVIDRVNLPEPVSFETPGDVVHACSEALQLCRSGQLDAKDYASMVSRLGRTVILAWQLVLPDKGNIQQEVSDLEHAIDVHDASGQFDLDEMPEDLRAALDEWLETRGRDD